MGTQPRTFAAEPLIVAGVVFLTPVAPALAVRPATLALVAGLLAMALASGAQLTHPDLAAITFAVWCVLSITWARFAELTSLAILLQVAVTLLYLAIRATARTASSLRTIAWGYLAGAATSIVVFAYQNGAAIDSWQSRDAGTAERLTVTGLNANYVAYSLVSGIPLAWYLARRSGARARAVLMAYSLAAIGVVVLTDSRGALVAIGLLIAFAPLSRVGRPRSTTLLKVALAATITVIAIGWADRSLVAIEGYFARNSGNLSGRLPAWQVARAAADDHPYIGLGIGGVPGVAGIEAHNIVLNLVAGVGVVGLALLMWTTWAALKDSDRHRAARGATAMLLVAWAPIVASGFWEMSVAAWSVLALVSRIPAVEDLHQEPSDDGASATERPATGPPRPTRPKL